MSAGPGDAPFDDSAVASARVSLRRPGNVDVEEAETVDLMLRLLRGAASVERRLDRMLAGARGISFSEFVLIRELATTHGGAAARVDLAASVGLTPSAVTRALKPLEKLGFVTTEKSDRDARRSIARLTAAGEVLFGDASGVVADGIASLGLDLGDRAPIDRLLHQLSR